MEIIKTNVDQNDKRALYKLTKSSGLMAQDAPDGVSIPVTIWALYSDPKEGRDGTVKDQAVLSFVSTDGSKYSTISQTFIRHLPLSGHLLFLSDRTSGKDSISSRVPCNSLIVAVSMADDSSPDMLCIRRPGRSIRELHPSDGSLRSSSYFPYFILHEKI